jgi:steroid 5-alpha reductase family enzyme
MALSRALPTVKPQTTVKATLSQEMWQRNERFMVLPLCFGAKTRRKYAETDQSKPLCPAYHLQIQSQGPAQESVRSSLLSVVNIFSIAFLIGMAGFWLLWPVSILRRDTSIVDFWWGPGFVAVIGAAWWMAGASFTGAGPLIVALVALWGLRLGVVLGARRLREGEEDPRYQDIRAAREPGFWWKSFFIVFTLQGVVQFVLASGAIAAVVYGADAIGTLAAFGAIAALAGAVIEARSDYQLDVFKRTHPHGKLLTTGLRSIVRYPSYAAEILFWAGIAMIAVDAGIWWAPICTLLLVALLMWISGVAVLDQRLTDTRPEYAAYKARVPALIPRLSRLTGGAKPTGSRQ